MVDLKKNLEEYPVEQSYTHQVDKKAIPTCPILGVNIAAIDMPWLLAFTEKHLGALSGDYICVSNVHTTVTAWKVEAYRAVQNGGILAIPDGGPLSSTGRKRGYEGMRRVTGPDYMLKAIELGLSKGWRHTISMAAHRRLWRKWRRRCGKDTPIFRSPEPIRRPSVP